MTRLMNLLTSHFGVGASGNKQTDAQPTKKSAVAVTDLATISASVQSELLDQLSEWHKLSEDGVVSTSEYKVLKKTILSDIKQLRLS